MKYKTAKRFFRRNEWNLAKAKVLGGYKGLLKTKKIALNVIPNIK